MIVRRATRACSLGLVAGLLLHALSGCSDGPADGACEQGSCDLDATTDSPTGRGPSDAARMDGSIKRNPLTPDAGPTGELQAKLQVNGANTQCGTCAVVLAQAQGGKQPYAYTWSDPALTGPGPHQVCPSAPTQYSVVVTDSTPTMTGEFATTAQQVEAVGSVDCVADAGSDGLLGCTYSLSVNGQDAGAPDAAMQTDCPNDAGVTFNLETGTQGTVTTSTFSPYAIKAGESYEYSHDRLLPLTLGVGDGLTVDVYAGRNHCDRAEKLFTLVYDVFTWHQTFCFKPQADYNYIVVSINLNGTLFSWELLTGATVCSGCSTTK